MHGPLTAAMVGLKISQPDSNEFSVGISQKVPSQVPTDPAPSFRSAPAQKARPSPVTMATHASWSSRKRSQAALRSWRMAPLMAFRRSGRRYVMVTTWPSCS